MRSDSRQLLVSELCAAHGWHGSLILLRLRDSLPDGLLDALIAAIAPQPRMTKQRWAGWRARCIRSMATRAACAAAAAMKHIVTELDHASRGPRRNGQQCGRGPGIRMLTLRRFRASRARRA